MSTDNGHPKYQRWAAVTMAFTPAAPIDDSELFAERPKQSMICLDALFQKGLHVALYGERGVGKTSLANVLPAFVRAVLEQRVDAVRIDCSTTSGYRSIWRNVFRELHIAQLQDDEWEDPECIRYALQQYERRALIVIDELDRVEDDECLSLLADTVKTLSDHAVPVTLMFVGVADSVVALIGEHDSIARSLVQVRMPRMMPSELEGVIAKGFAKANMTIDDEAAAHITKASEGLPHFIHLLCLHAGQYAAMDERDAVTASDLEQTLVNAVDSHSILSEYQQAIQSPQPDHLFEEVLLACAYTPRNALGFFRAGDVRDPLSAIVGRPMGIANFQRHLNEMSSPKRGYALQKDGVKRHFVYRFTNPLLQPYAKLRGQAKGLIPDELRQQLQEAQEAQDMSRLFDSPSELVPPS